MFVNKLFLPARIRSTKSDKKVDSKTDQWKSNLVFDRIKN